jgi:hypothetical protein
MLHKALLSSEKDPEGSFGETAVHQKKEQMCILRSGTRQPESISEQSNTQYVKKKRDAIKL